MTGPPRPTLTLKLTRLRPPKRRPNDHDYRRARMLFNKHRLVVPASVIEMIAKTIAKRYKLGLRPSPRKRMIKALAHASRLLEYAERGAKSPRLAASVSKRSASLSRVLSDFDVGARLAMTARIDIDDVLDRINRLNRLKQPQAGRLLKDVLIRLISALKAELSATGKSGRPREETAHVLRGACRAWLLAGRTEKCTWDYYSGTTKGPLAKFARDLLKQCRLEVPEDSALYRALLDGLRSCRGSLRR
jgi:hypothetical protein